MSEIEDQIEDELAAVENEPEQAAVEDEPNILANRVDQYGLPITG